MIFAVVPACGRSVRMGRPKLLLPFGDRTVVERVILALRQGGADEVVVVIGPHVPQLAPLAVAGGASVLALPEATADMRATVEHGLSWVEERFHPTHADAWLLAPGDHPTLDAGIVQRLIVARREQPQLSVFLPTHAGRRGHPALIGWQHVAGMRSLPLGVGLNVYLRSQAAETGEVPAGEEVLWDLDTPEDYERLRERHG
jgi:molybdenum cofactor cytidylyltransferase